MNATAERRLAPRTSFAGVAIVRTQVGDHTAVAGNLSEDGILVYPRRPSPVRPGTPLHVAFALPTTLRWVSLEGTLVRRGQHNGRHAWGIRFNEVPAGVLDDLRSFVACGEPAPAPAPRGRSVTPPRPLTVPTRRSDRITAPLKSTTRTTERRRRGATDDDEPTRQWSGDRRSAAVDRERPGSPSSTAEERSHRSGEWTCTVTPGLVRALRKRCEDS